MKKRTYSNLESLILEHQKRKKERERKSITDDAANWAALPNDLLHRIYTTLRSDLGDFVRFRAVCKGWRNFNSLPNHLPKTPWLFECLYPDYIGSICPQPNLHFYSLASGHTGEIPAPEQYYCDGMDYYGPGHGYFLVSSPKEDPYLLNPLNGNKILLPGLNLDTFSIHSQVCSGLAPRHNWYIVSDQRMTSDHDEWAMAWTCIIYRPDENSWTYIDVDISGGSCHTCCFDGMLYATGDGPTVVYGIISGEKLYQVQWPTDEDSNVISTHLVGSSGDILRVSLYYYKEDSDGEPEYTEDIEDSRFEIYKLCSEEEEGGGKRHFWVEVTDIGNQILFLDAMNDFSLKAPPGLDGNCIYFMSDTGSKPSRYDIGTHTVQVLPCPFDRCTWFIPTLE